MNGDLTLSSCRIADNHSAGNGGGIYSQNSDLMLTHCEIIENTAVSSGGGIYFYGYYETTEINNSEISFNGSSLGGGLTCEGNSAPVLKNVIIADNSAQSQGAGIFCSDGVPSFYNCTLTGNQTPGSGGGVCLIWESFPVFINSVLWANSPEEVAFADENQPFYYVPTKISFSYCDVQGGEGGINPLDYDLVYWLEGNIDEDPLFIGLGDDPFALSENSPAVDQGTPDPAGLNLPPTDFLGNYRLWDGDGDGMIRIDMGAYEFGSLPVGTDNDPELPLLNGYAYPNPFISCVNFEFSATESSLVRIEVSDIIGTEVFTHVEMHLGPGVHKSSWIAVNCKPGIYIYKISTNKGTFAGKLIKV
jgi:predicted outer membrane repeat protein